MGSPDGGWYDETPPKIVSTSPAEYATKVSGKRVQINFDEYIKVENAQEKVTISPPQSEQPEIKTTGKGIRIDLKDSLQANTTYTIDFSDAIVDNNESNPLGNYTFTFSTGEKIDTMEVAGYVINAEDLEPVKGMLVGLYSNLSDTAFTTMPMQRVARTDASGHFIIRGVAEGQYRIYGLEDSDGDYRLSQRGERLAFNHEIYVPSSKPDIRQDTTWVDSLHIKGISRVPYTHFLPDDICLRAFTQEQTDRYFVKAERQDPDHFSLFYSYGCDALPLIRGINFDSDDAFVIEPSERGDTITYWLRDQKLVDSDTLRLEMQYLMTDSLGQLVSQSDTLEVLAKTPYAKRMKELENKRKEWEKQIEKQRKRGEENLPTEMPAEALEPQYIIPSTMTPMKNISIKMPTPLDSLNSDAIHLYAKQDTVWYKVPFVVNDTGLPPRTYEIQAEWKLNTEYSLEVDSAAFRDIYGRVSDATKKGIKVPGDETFSTLFVEVRGIEQRNIIVELLQSDKVVAQQPLADGRADFYYVRPGEYYIRCFVDNNENGLWDTGDYALDRQPEQLYYHPDKIECRERWDLTVTMNPLATPLYNQKPEAIKKQKADSKKAPKSQNLQRAQKLGIPLPQ